MFTVRKVFRFEAAHVLASAFSKACTDSIHGHSYVVEVFLRSRELNQDGMVVDFGLVKELISDLIATWDHALILPSCHKPEDFGGKKTVIFPCNPTAENMAFVLFKQIRDRLWGSIKNSKEGLIVWKVRVHETTTGWAEFERDER